MRLSTGQPFWPARDGLPASFPPLEEAAECDVLVVGAGITGALAAHELASRGHDVVVLDRRDAAMGSTAASTALLLYEVDPEFRGLRRALGPDAARETYLRMAESVAALADLSRTLGAGEFALRPSLYLASRPGHVARLRREFRARDSLGLDVEWLDGAQLRREYGCTRTAAIRSGGQGHMDPYAFTHALLQGRRRRLRVHDRTAVQRVSHGPRGITAWTDRGARVQARHVVHATGYETRLHPRTFRTRLYATYALATEPGVELWADHAMFWETNRPYAYGRCTADGRLLVGGYNDAWVAAAPAADLAAKVRGIRRGAKRLFPGLQFEVAYAWGGRFAETRDGLPYVGPDPKHPNSHFVLGYGANGTVFAHIGAKLTADRIDGTPSRFRAFEPRVMA